MSGFVPIFKRELLSLWVTPIAWVVLFFFLVIQGISFSLIVSHLGGADAISYDSGPVQSYFGQSLFIIITLFLACPALTMRLFAEERKSGTIEALMTAPVSPAGVVLGKYAATLATYIAMWAPTILYVVILQDTGTIDWKVLGSSYLGVLGIGAGYLGVGVLMSAMTQNQLIAFLMTALVIFGLFILGIAEYVLPAGPLRDTCAHVSVFSQMDDFSKGIVDLRRVVFDITLVVLPLFLAVRVVDSWRWD